MKNCLDYGAESDDFLAAWPEDRKCVTITDGESKGIPNGHGCKCDEDNCNFDMCTAAGNNGKGGLRGSKAFQGVLLIHCSLDNCEANNLCLTLYHTVCKCMILYDSVLTLTLDFKSCRL